MAYAKITASSKSKNKKPEYHAQADTLTNEQEKLLDILRKSRGQPSKKDPGSKILKPVHHGLKRMIELSQRFRKHTIEEETVEEKKQRLMKLLGKFESPFIWKPTQEKPLNEPGVSLYRFQEKDREIEDKRKFKWRNFILKLLISYELYRKDEVSAALEIVEGLESTLLDLEHSCREWLFLGVQDALKHVVSTSKAYLFLKLDLIKEAEEIINRIQPLNIMKRSCKAGIHGIRAAVFMEYGHKGNKIAVKEAMEAVNLDKICPEWHFLVGKCMGRIRRVSKCFELVDETEIKSINKAADLDKDNALYLVYLGQVLKEKAFRLSKKHQPKKGSKEYQKIAKIYWAAMYKFREARDMQPNCPHILMRCAQGMMKLPLNMVDLKFMRESIDKAIELAPNNPMAYHIKGMYYERYHVEADTAMEAYKTAASLDNFGAGLDVVRMRFRLGLSNIVEDLEKLADRFEEPCKIEQAYSQAGSYLLFIKKNFVEAVKYYTKVVDLDRDSYSMKCHKPIFLRMKAPVNMFHVLLEELGEKTLWDSFTPEDKLTLRGFLIKIVHHDKDKPKEEKLTVEKIIEMSRSTEETDDNTRKRWQLKRKNPKKTGPKMWKGKKKALSNKDSTNKKESKLSETNLSNNKNFKVNVDEFVFKPQYEHYGRSSSVSSVDSDYNRNSIVHGPRGFYLGDSNEHLSKEKTDQSVSYPTLDKCNHGYKTAHHSNYLQQENSVNVPCKSQLTVQNLNKFDAINSNSTLSRSMSKMSISSRGSENEAGNLRDGSKISTSAEVNLPRRMSMMSISSQGSENEAGKDSSTIGPSVEVLLPRKMSMMSISSVGTGSQLGSSDSLSVLERVKQSYSMLSYKKTDEQRYGKNKNFSKSSSSQSLNIDQTKQKRKGSNTKNFHFEKSGSTQSLNIQPESSFKFPEDYKSSFRSRDSSVGSSRSSSFLPSFASRSSGTNSEKQ